MPAINFNAQFADQVRSGKKRQTIRARGKRRPPRVGETLSLYMGIGSRKLLDAVCTSVELIGISTTAKTVQIPRMFGADPRFVFLDDDEIEELAKADGFDNAESFFAWFSDHYGKTFSGYLIKW